MGMASETETRPGAGAAAPEAGTVKPTEAQAFRFWLRLGMISFGGPLDCGFGVRNGGASPAGS